MNILFCQIRRDRERVQSKFHAHPSSLMTEKRMLLNGVLQINSIIVVSYNSIQFNSIYINIFILITNYPSIHPDPSTHPSIPIHPSIYLQCTHPSSHPSDRVWFFRFSYQTFHASNLVSILLTLFNCMHCK